MFLFKISNTFQCYVLLIIADEKKKHFLNTKKLAMEFLSLNE